MSQPNIVWWLRRIFGPFSRSLSVIARPWTDLRAVKDNQVDIINAAGDLRADLASALASVKEIKQELIRLDARTAGLEASVRQIATSAESKRRADD